MGNSTGLAYDILDTIEYNGNNTWQLNSGSKKGVEKESAKQNVTIFRFPKVGRADRLPLAQRNVQKLRTIRFPYILSFIESAEMEDALVLITESCVPLEVWLKKMINDSSIPKQHLLQELTWGFKCVLRALDFLHSNCSAIHGNLGLHSIFVTPNGDWKISNLELFGNFNNQEDINLFINHQNMLDKYYCSPERQALIDRDSAKIESTLKAKIPPFYIDMYSFGQCMEKAFGICQEELAGSLSKYIATTINVDIKKRPTAKKLLQTATFNSDYIKILENVQEFSVKGTKEILEAIGQLDPLIPQMTVAICTFKVLPSVCRVLQIAINEFQNRDAREQSRQSIVVCMDLLSKLGEHKKLDEQAFEQECVGIVSQLWTMPDRTLRTSMLSSLKHLCDLIPNKVINSSLFDNMLAGFSDSNAKLRETTLMSLIYVVDKLDENQLQDRLVRCLSNLQNDPEASIRTNTTIFFGKIASKLKEAVRQRVLCNVLAKSMKDNFLHCRIAGLKTSTACLKLMDAAQLASKIIPQCSILLLDKSPEVRILALSLMEQCTGRMRQYHELMLQAGRENGNKDEDGSQQNKAANSNNSSSVPTSGSGMDLNSWTSWSGTMLQGISKTIDQTPSTPTSSSVGASSAVNSTPSSSKPPVNEYSSAFSEKVSVYKQANKPKSIVKTADDDWEDFGDDDNNMNHNNSSKVSTLNTSSAGAGWGDDLDGALDFDDDDDGEKNNYGNGNSSSKVQATKKSAFDDLDDLDLGDDDDDVYRPPPSKSKPTTTASSSSSSSSAPAIIPPAAISSPATARPAVSSMSLPSAKPVVSSSSVEPVSTKSKKPVKLAVKKLDVGKDDDWEDF